LPFWIIEVLDLRVEKHFAGAAACARVRSIVKIAIAGHKVIFLDVVAGILVFPTNRCDLLCSLTEEAK